MQVFENLRSIQHAPGVQMQEVSRMQMLPSPQSFYEVQIRYKIELGLRLLCFIVLLVGFNG